MTRDEIWSASWVLDSWNTSLQFRLDPAGLCSIPIYQVVLVSLGNDEGCDLWQLGLLNLIFGVKTGQFEPKKINKWINEH